MKKKHLLFDGRTRVLLACCSLPAIAETAYLVAQSETGDIGIIFAMFAVITCLMMALLPRVGGWAVVALWVARCVVPQSTPFSILFCLLMAVTVMAYLSLGWALLAAVIAELAAASRFWLYPWDTATLAIVCATAAFLMTALWLGSLMSWQEQREVEQQERAELLRRLGNQQVANQLHHSVANDLTTIVLLARQLPDDGKQVSSAENPAAAGDDSGHGDVVDTYGRSTGNGDVSLRTLIEQTATTSLGKVRMLIATLDDTAAYPTGLGSNSTSSSGDSGELWLSTKPGSPAKPSAAIRQSSDSLGSIDLQELRDIAADHDSRLHAAGLTGETILVCDCACGCAETAAGVEEVPV